MLEFESAIIGGWLGQFVWPFFRISSFFLAAPIIGTRLVPGRIRIVLSLLMTAMLAPHLPPMPVLDAVTLEAFILSGQQILIGLALAMVLQMLLQMFVMAGQVIAMQMGLGFAQMVDPTNGVSVTVLSQFHLLLATLLFVTMDGHLAMIEVMAESFTVLPVGAGFLSSNAVWGMMSWISWMFAGALLMALPAITSLLIVNASLGIITRAAPQMNIFAIGFPFMLLLGLCIIWVSLTTYLPHFDVFTREALKMMAQLLL